MIIILVQIFSVTLSSILMLLNSRVQRLIVPITDYRSYVEWREPVLGDEVSVAAAGDVRTVPKLREGD
jgi:hypothetical protein